jgi:hypothetical protein
MTAFGFLVLGLVAAVIVVAVRNQRRYLDTEPWRAWPLESDGIDLDIPDWVNDAPPPIVLSDAFDTQIPDPASDTIEMTWVNDGRPLEQRFIEAVDFALWEADRHNEDEDA